MSNSSIYPNAREVARALQPSYPVYCLSPATLAHTANRFLTGFPGRVLYAVKCNPHPRVLSTLYEAGIRHFDTASLPEIAQVREAHRDAETYFMHPVKARAVVRTAYEVYGVRQFVIDHPAELDKVLEVTGGEGIVVHVRVKTPEAKAFYDLASKFGAPPEQAGELLKAVRSAGLRCGLAFHVGSQCMTTDAYRQALTIVGDVVKQAGSDIDFLDVGGGFPAQYPGEELPSLEDYFSVLIDGVKDLGVRNDCVLMCEPGRAMVADACSLLVQVLLRKESEIYINDGIYGSLAEIVITKMRLPVRLIRLDGEYSDTNQAFTVYGPTCDSLDVLPHPFELPDDVREGDWLEIGQIGAYSNAAATRFNGFYPETFVDVEQTFTITQSTPSSTA
ncbi:MAG: type III PLP-dependent enzyme [Gammaproteobacteria bacterium]|nr:type III PLP-dependent enzyme [Gammaproteobacteria bacterium]